MFSILSGKAADIRTTPGAVFNYADKIIIIEVYVHIKKILSTVREKRAGILKPQGSLERAREERRAAPAAEVTCDVLRDK